MTDIQVTINGTDISTIGMTFQDGAISALMALPPAKEYITNNKPFETGKEYIGGGYLNEMELSLPFNIVAKSRIKFFENYIAFRNLISSGDISIKIVIQCNATKYTLTPNAMKYMSCTQFSHYNLDMAQFVLKVVQPVPGLEIKTEYVI